MNDESWVIIDTETSGLMQPIFAVEIAGQRMKGWEPEGKPFRVLLNHDVAIDPMAQSVHGYSREFLRRNGQDPKKAHKAFHEYAADLPIVAYNISFDWNRVLEPEYKRLDVPQTGKRGFCALTLARRVINETDNHRLETLNLVADVPLVRKTGSSQGKSFRLKLTVNLVSLQIAVSGPEAPRFP